MNRAGLEAVGLVHEHNFGNGSTQGYTSIRIWWKKAALRPWVVAPITFAATPGSFAGGRGCAAAESPTGTTIAEVSAGHLSLVPCDISHHVPQRQPLTVTLGKMGTDELRGGRDPDMPWTPPRYASSKKHFPPLPAPLLECHLRTLPFLTFDPLFQVLLLWLL